MMSPRLSRTPVAHSSGIRADDGAGIRLTGYLVGQGNRHLHTVVTNALSEGRSTAARTTIAGPGGTYAAVEVRAGSFDRDPGSTCWHRVGAAKGLGRPAMTTPGDRFLAPRRRGAAIELTQIQKDGTRAVHLISPTTKRLISSRAVFADGARLVIRAYSVLSRTPAITAPGPRCPAGAKPTP